MGSCDRSARRWTSGSLWSLGSSREALEQTFLFFSHPVVICDLLAFAPPRGSDSSLAKLWLHSTFIHLTFGNRGHLPTSDPRSNSWTRLVKRPFQCKEAHDGQIRALGEQTRGTKVAAPPKPAVRIRGATLMRSYTNACFLHPRGCCYTQLDSSRVFLCLSVKDTSHASAHVTTLRRAHGCSPLPTETIGKGHVGQMSRRDETSSHLVGERQHQAAGKQSQRVERHATLQN